MKDSIFNNCHIDTPAYVYDQIIISSVMEQLSDLKNKTGLKPLYSIKSASLIELLKIIKTQVEGFSCSSLFEAKLSKEVLDKNQSLHITTPGYIEKEWDEIIELSDYITLNSIHQWQFYAEKISQGSNCGIRINPDISFVKDKRYDPCREYSKLGITFEQLNEYANTLKWEFINGIHVHNNCESSSFSELQQSVDKLIDGLVSFNPELRWINLGGGYLFDKNANYNPLIETVSKLKERFEVDVFIEPGKAITGRAGYLVSTVIDIIKHNKKTIAVLDTSINHLPEVFEYQYQPSLCQSVQNAHYEYQLVGCSCLSGDLFGDYYFEIPLEVGSQIVFENVGSYMQVKSNTFNGINLPVCYLYDGERELKLIKEYDYESYRSRN